MAETTKGRSIKIRAGQDSLAFLTKEADGSRAFHPYQIKTGMSVAANLREAFRTEEYLRDGIDYAELMVTTPVILLPVDEYNNLDEELTTEDLYSSVMTGHKGEEKIVRPMDDFDAVGIFTVNSDLHMVVTDNCKEVAVHNVIYPVWQHFYNRYYQSGQRRKLFAYFHDKSVDVCQFEHGRVRFANTFDATHAHDALYYILFAWKQLGMNQAEDDLFIIGAMPHEQWLRGRLATYVTRIHDINVSASLNRSPLAEIEGMPFDMMIE